MGWQDDPVIEQPSRAKSAWMEDPVVEAAPEPSYGEKLGNFTRAEFDTIKRELTPANLASAAVRPVVQAVTAVPGIFADAAMGAYNLATGKNQELPSQATARVLDQYTRKPEGVGKAAEFVSATVLGSRMLPSPKPAPPQAPAPPSSAQAVIAEGERRGVPVFYDDVTKNAMAKRVGVAAESLGPLGTGSGRGAQQKAAKDAAQRVVEQYAPNVGDDVPELVQKGLQTKLGQFRKTAGTLYQRAAQELDPQGPVPLSQMEGAIAKAAAEQKRLGTLANPQVAALLEKYTQAPRGNFSLARELRSQLGADISDFYTGGNAAIGDKGVKALQAMKEALEADMAGFAQKIGGKGHLAWRAADGFYKANIVPFKEAGFRDLVKTAEPEKAWRYLLAQGSLKSRSVRMYSSLDEDGRAAVRYGLVKDAMDNAVDPKGVFSPARFSKYLEDHESAVGTFFKGRDLKEIQGFQNLMRHVERAGQYAENPPTGQRLIPFLFGGAAFVSPQAAAGVASAGVTVRALFQTKTGRNLLLAMGRTKPGSAAATAISARINRYLLSAGAVASAAPEENSPAAMLPPTR
jgi:hypothetical protein